MSYRRILFKGERIEAIIEAAVQGMLLSFTLGFLCGLGLGVGLAHILIVRIQQEK